MAFSKNIRRNFADACGAGVIEIADKPEILGACPSGCGGEIGLAQAANPLHGGAIEPTVTHTIPFCDYYGETDAGEVIKAMKKAVRRRGRR